MTCDVNFYESGYRDAVSHEISRFAEIICHPKQLNYLRQRI